MKKMKSLWVGITNNDRPYGCPIIYTDTNSQGYFVHRYLNNAWHKKAHSIIWTPCLTIIASKVENLCRVKFENGSGKISDAIANLNLWCRYLCVGIEIK